MLDPVSQLRLKLAAVIAEQPQATPQQIVEAFLLCVADVTEAAQIQARGGRVFVRC